MADEQLYALAERVGQALQARGWKLTTAESCTGGWIAQAVTAVPGSSAWFERGVVTYTNVAKQEMLGVNGGTLAAHGAVSEETVREMAKGALGRSHAQVAVAVSGIAGPDDGHGEISVGTVWFALAITASDVQSLMKHFDGDREAVRRAAVAFALEQIRVFVETS